MARLTEYFDGEARVVGIGHKIAFAKLAAYENTGLTPEEIEELKAQEVKLREALIVASRHMPDMIHIYARAKCKSCGEVIDCASYVYCEDCARNIINTALGGQTDAK